IGLAVVVDSPYINKNTVCCAMLQLSDFKLTATQLHHTLAAAQLDTRFACLCQQSFPVSKFILDGADARRSSKCLICPSAINSMAELAQLWARWVWRAFSAANCSATIFGS